MGWRLAADAVMLVHFSFVVFVLLGGFLAWRWPRAVAFHVGAVVYGVVILVVGFTCPLTPVEKSLRLQAGDAGYDGGFVEHYVVRMLYPGELTALVQAGMVVGLLLVNVAAYTVTLRRHRSRTLAPS